MSEINTRQLDIVSRQTPRRFIGWMESLGYECRLLRGGRLVQDRTDVDREGVRTVVFVPVEPSLLRTRVVGS